MPHSRPNVLFLMDDEHRADVLGYAGNKIVRTPHLDRLAERAVIFDHAYAAAPICVPGRQCLMSGQYPLNCGCQNYGEDLEPGYETFARAFTREAYHTVACGKLHHMGMDQMQGWRQRIGADCHVMPEYIADRNKEAYAAQATARGWLKWSEAKEIQKAGNADSRQHSNDRYALQGALDFIRFHYADHGYERSLPSEPVLLKVSFVQPHYPYFADADQLRYYFDRVQPFLNEPVFDHPFLQRLKVRPGVDVTEHELRTATAAYYAMIETVDDYFGQITRALEKVGQNLDDWIIIYTSDHGEMLGEHGLWEKQKFFEGSVRVPLFIRWPKSFPHAHHINRNVSHCDLFATLCDLAGLPAPSGIDSRSLVPLMRDRSAAWDDTVISQYSTTNFMVKRGPLKYQRYAPGEPELLFDLDRDPAERKSFLHDPSYAERLGQLRRRLDEYIAGATNRVHGNVSQPIAATAI